MLKRLIEVANRWRTDHGYTERGGVVVIYEGEVQSWCAVLPSASDWVSGCMAVDNAGQIWQTIAGTEQDGALMWLPLKRGRGRPKTGTARSGAERQAAYRAKKQADNVTVTINRGLLDSLDAQMQAIRDGSTVQVLTQEQASEILKALRTANLKQLRG
ncbi:hypothetical protein [Aeromonas veronii]|uniref:hypothetical protein n=1 Tax=Aeromonas veronii TaxID=654 RepID=UPI003D222269